MSSVKPITINQSEDYLRKEAKVVTNFSEDLLTWEVELLERYVKMNKVNIVPASQLGVPKRIIYLLDDNQGKVLINPRIVEKKGLTKSWEECGSLPKTICKIRRPYEIVVEYQDINGTHLLDIFEGEVSTKLSHEIDHLNGILPTDIADEVFIGGKYEIGMIKAEEPYEIISRDLIYDNQEIYDVYPLVKKLS